MYYSTVERGNISDLRPGDWPRLQPETKWLGGGGSMDPFSMQRKGINDDDYSTLLYGYNSTRALIGC